MPSQKEMKRRIADVDKQHLKSLTKEQRREVAAAKKAAKLLEQAWDICQEAGIEFLDGALARIDDAHASNIYLADEMASIDPKTGNAPLEYINIPLSVAELTTFQIFYHVLEDWGRNSEWGLDD